jgi:capsular polysaccharide biosynthesis protein
MSQQPLDLRMSLRIARQYRVLIGGLAAVGLLVGVGYSVLNPPKATAEALVVIPQLTSSAGPAVSGDGTVITSGTETQVLIAGSDPVLQRALPDITPATTLQDLRTDVQVTNPAGAIIAIDGHSTSGAQAVDMANAVAKTYVAYVDSGSSPSGRMDARLLQPAADPTGESFVQGLLPGALIGIIAGALIGFLVALARSRGQRRLRERDAIANAVGVPVIAAVPVAHGSDAAAWTRLLDEYEPSVVHAWQLRKMLHQLGITELRPDSEESHAASLAILTLSSDKRALALGPQLATFAASLGIRTVLAVARQQDPVALGALYTACAAPPDVLPRRRRPLRTLVVEDKRSSDLMDADFVVLVVVVDGDAPQIMDTMRTDLTMLGVSAGAATAEELARVATVADTDGRGILGILVADPDTADRTTGRIPQLYRVQRTVPNRVNGIPTEISR